MKRFNGRQNAAFAVLSVGLFIAGCSSTDGNFSSVPNPYVTPDGSGTQVATMRVFGDSYSVSGSWGAPWSNELQAAGRVVSVDQYAVGGAQAGMGRNNSFNNQIDQYLTAGAPRGPRDLTVAYFGYNDIGRGGSGDGLANARAGYQLGVNRLVAAGAIEGDNRLFLTQIHDWSKNPGVNPAVGAEVLAWNDYVASVANQSSNFVAVDLYTVFENVYRDPGRFGLVNVTDVNPSRARVDFLYHDEIHFGAKGASIIARTFNHYLTRGWDWANSLSAGAEASAQLQRDLDGGLLFLQFQETFNDSTEPLGLRALNLGETGSNQGVLLDYNARVGVALFNRNQSLENQVVDNVANRRDLSSEGFAAYHNTTLAGISSRTQLSSLQHTQHASAYDGLIDRGVRQRVDSNSLAIQQQFSGILRVQGMAFAPWLGVTHRSVSMDDNTYRTLYTSRTHVSSDSYSELVLGNGVQMFGQPIALGYGNTLQLSGSFGVEQSLHRSDVSLQFAEAALPGVRQNETVSLPGFTRQTGGISARLALSQGVDITLGYSVTEENGDQSDLGMLTLTHQF